MGHKHKNTLFAFSFSLVLFLFLVALRHKLLRFSGDIQGRYLLPIFPALIVFQVMGTGVIFKKRIEDLSAYFFWFSLFQFYFILFLSSSPNTMFKFWKKIPIFLIIISPLFICPIHWLSRQTKCPPSRSIGPLFQGGRVKRICGMLSGRKTARRNLSHERYLK